MCIVLIIRFIMRLCCSSRNIWNSMKNILKWNLKPYKVVTLGNVSSTLHVPECIAKPDYDLETLQQQRNSTLIEIKTEDEIDNMAKAGALARHVLQVAKSKLKPGISKDSVDKIVHNEIISHGAYPSPLHYKGFPKSCCTSVNNVVCHGIPDDCDLTDGDIINIDITVYYKGFHGDTSDTFPVGNVDDDGLRLIRTTQECLRLAIDVCEPGASFDVIGEVIENHANKSGFAICRQYIGHGIGSYFHGPPNVWHFKTHRSDSRRMQPGMTFTIEPILMEGSHHVRVSRDGWTVVSRDGGRSAQSEHTILITNNGCKILT